MKSGTAEGGKTMAIEEAEQRGGGGGVRGRSCLTVVPSSTC